MLIFHLLYFIFLFHLVQPNLTVSANYLCILHGARLFSQSAASNSLTHQLLCASVLLFALIFLVIRVLTLSYYFLIRRSGPVRGRGGRRPFLCVWGEEEGRGALFFWAGGGGERAPFLFFWAPFLFLGAFFFCVFAPFCLCLYCFISFFCTLFVPKSLWSPFVPCGPLCPLVLSCICRCICIRLTLTFSVSRCHNTKTLGNSVGSRQLRLRTLLVKLFVEALCNQFQLLQTRVLVRNVRCIKVAIDIERVIACAHHLQHHHHCRVRC